MRSTRVPNPEAPPELARRLFSLSGIVPIGAFVLVHVGTNLLALWGDATFANVVRALQHLPALPLVEWGIVLLPLAFHAAVGSWLVITRRPLSGSSPYSRVLGATMRVTGVVALAFLVMHLPEFRFRVPGVHLDGGQLATVLAADLSSTWHGLPWRGAAYLVSAGCVAFHFAAGLWGFFATTRLGRGERAERARGWAGWGAGVFGAVVWILLANVVVYHATGSRLVGGPRGDAPRGPCPADVAK